MGVVESEGARLRHVANGVCQSGTGDLSARLLGLFSQLEALVAEHRPDAAAVEQTFVNRDGAGTLKLGQARGVALLALAGPGWRWANTPRTRSRRRSWASAMRTRARSTNMVRLQLPAARPRAPMPPMRWRSRSARDHLQARAWAVIAMLGVVVGRLDYTRLDQ